MRTNSLIILVILLAAVSFAKADRCSDEILLDGSETIVSYGMDTTNHWWAVTSPFTNTFRLIVDGKASDVYNEFTELVFSPNGEKCACYAKDSKQWYLLTEEGASPLPGTEPGEINYSPNSEVMSFSYMEAEQETILTPTRKIRVYQRTGRYFLSFGGERLAFLGYRGNGMVVNINGKESHVFDEIKPLGFWSDGGFLYSARNGNLWELYKDEKALTESYSEISEMVINLTGTAAGLIAKTTAGTYHGVLISDEYYEPLVSKFYDFASNITIHPTNPIIAFSAVYNSRSLVVMSSTEFSGGQQTSKPRFTCDGSDLYFFGCDIDCFVNISGRKISTNNQLSLDADYAMKPGDMSIAYASSSSMVIRLLQTNELIAGRMLDEVKSPRYNWRNKQYESLGRISQRLYFLRCKI